MHLRRLGSEVLKEEELIRRAAFALLASVALHDKKAEDNAFLECIPLMNDVSRCP